jgi:glucan phosphoethanolaminetransferase (alkaline phosphatase superfamily)
MNTSDDHSKSVKRLAKSLPVIIFLFIVFACVFATLVLHFSNEGLECKIFALICFLAVLPLIGFIVFFWVAKAKAINSNKNEADFRENLKTDIMNEMRPLMEKTMEEIKEILELFSKINLGKK